MRRSKQPFVEIVSRPPIVHGCVLPGWLERRRLKIVIGTVVECIECDQRWKWEDIGWSETNKCWCRVPCQRPPTTDLITVNNLFV